MASRARADAVVEEAVAGRLRVDVAKAAEGGRSLWHDHPWHRGFMRCSVFEIIVS